MLGLNSALVGGTTVPVFLQGMMFNILFSTAVLYGGLVQIEWDQ